MVELMTAMFSSSAPTQSGALRDADLKLMSSEKYSHPYYWAAFTVVGDGARPMPAREASTKVAALTSSGR